MSKRVAIIGGGASGLLCAIQCSKGSCTVDIFEQNDKCAKKILVSGNGRCNITNKNLTTHDYFGQNPYFVKDAIEQFGYKEFTNFASSFGLILNTLDDGRAYPLSNESKSVASLLTTYATNLGVNIKINTKIKNIKELIKNYDAVVVATGSYAAEHLGGCNDGYNFAREFGHNIIATYPSLVQLHLNSTIAHKMSGVKTQGEVTLLVNNKKDISINGDILFTNYGVSGFAILDISQRASKALLEFAKVDISVNLLPTYNSQKLSTHIINLAKAMPKLVIIDILVGLIPLKLAQGILQTLELSQSTKIDTKLSKKIANLILNWRFEVTNTHGFRHAEVSGGGIDVSEINPKTFESLRQKNLYFCGEVLDIVGKRGGYNFAFAWASGYLCAKDITE